jgi:hypothetical protein
MVGQGGKSKQFTAGHHCQSKQLINSQDKHMMVWRVAKVKTADILPGIGEG